jgi:hypothetical protein
MPRYDGVARVFLASQASWPLHVVTVAVQLAALAHLQFVVAPMRGMLPVMRWSICVIIIL